MRPFAFPVALLALAAPVRAGGQDLPTQLPPLSPAAIAESIAVIRQMDSALKRNARDAAAWYRRGRISWILAEQHRQGAVIDAFSRIDLQRMADTSLRLANEYDPTNPHYMVTIGQLFLGSGFLSFSRLFAYRWFDRALDVARKSDDPRLRAEAALEVGRVSWRRYDALAFRRIETNTDVLLQSMTSATGARTGSGYVPPHQIQRHINESTIELPAAFSGEADYIRAENLFREAYEASPGETRTFRHVAMVLAERDRWGELRGLAQQHLKVHPRDPWAWLSLGLAEQRLRRSGAAEAAFDSALVHLDPRERARLDRIERVVSPRDTARYAILTSAERASATRNHWASMDPLWARDGDDAHTEFLARVTYAELRWTVEELRVRGADSDRGNVHVRYGPPDVRLQLGPEPSGDRDMDRGGRSAESVVSDQGADGEAEFALLRTSVTTIWAYRNGLLFFFRGMPTYATSYIPPSDRADVDETLDSLPSRWANATDIDVEPMPAHVTRFRWSRDSVAVVVAVDPPVAAMQERAAVNAPVRVDLWVGGDTSTGVWRDSATLRTQQPKSWSFAVAPGEYGYRVEATSDAVSLAGRTGGALIAGPDATTGFGSRGFGMSDVLLAGAQVPRATADRWHGLGATPIGPSIPRDGELTLIWENYEFGERDGAATYELTITIQREFQQLLSRVRARVIAGVSDLLGIERAEGRVIYRYSRTVPHAATLVEYIGLSMPDTPPGEYVLTVHVRDVVTGGTTQRAAKLIIRE